MSAKPIDPFAPVTLASLREELKAFKSELREDFATKADLESMGRKLVMWNAGLLLVLVALFATIVGWLISRTPATG